MADKKFDEIPGEVVSFASQSGTPFVDVTPPSPAIPSETEVTEEFQPQYFTKSRAEMMEEIAKEPVVGRALAATNIAPGLGFFLDPETRQQIKTAEAEYPGTAIASMLATPIPGTGKLRGVAALGTRLAIGLGLSGLVEAAHAEPGKRYEAVKEMLTGGEYPIPLPIMAAGAGEALGGIVSKFRGKPSEFIARKIGEADVGLEAKAQKQLQDLFESARGSYGKDVQEAMHDVREIRAAIESPNVSQATKDSLIAHLASPAGIELQERAAQGLLERAPTRVSEMQATQKAMQEASVTPEKVQALKAELGAHPIKSEVLPRAKRYATRAASVAATGALGPAAGMATSVMLGDVGTSYANMMRAPSLRKAAWEAVQKVLIQGPEKAKEIIGISGPILSRELMTKGPAAAQVLHDLLMQRNEEVLQKSIQLAQDSNEPIDNTPNLSETPEEHKVNAETDAEYRKKSFGADAGQP